MVQDDANYLARHDGMGASNRGLKATLTFFAWAKSTVVHCEYAIGLTCRNVSVEEGMLCLTEIGLAIGEPGGGGPRPTVAGA
jgi:hypothetical protein